MRNSILLVAVLAGVAVADGTQDDLEVSTVVPEGTDREAAREKLGLSAAKGALDHDGAGGLVKEPELKVLAGEVAALFRDEHWKALGTKHRLSATLSKRELRATVRKHVEPPELKDGKLLLVHVTGADDLRVACMQELTERGFALAPAVPNASGDAAAILSKSTAARILLVRAQVKTQSFPGDSPQAIMGFTQKIQVSSCTAEVYDRELGRVIAAYTIRSNPDKKEREDAEAGVLHEPHVHKSHDLQKALATYRQDLGGQVGRLLAAKLLESARKDGR